jgi:hypothetical protein
MKRRDRSPSVVKLRKFRKLKHLSTLIKPKSDLRLELPMDFAYSMESNNRNAAPYAADLAPTTLERGLRLKSAQTLYRYRELPGSDRFRDAHSTAIRL